MDKVWSNCERTNLCKAAPALLEALEEALAFVEGREYSVRLREKARAAIAQAKGKK